MAEIVVDGDLGDRRRGGARSSTVIDGGGWGDGVIDERRAVPAARCRRPTATSATDERAATGSVDAAVLPLV